MPRPSCEPCCNPSEMARTKESFQASELIILCDAITVLNEILEAVGGETAGQDLKSIGGRTTAAGDTIVIPAVPGKAINVYAYALTTPTNTALLVKLTSGLAGVELWRMSFRAPTDVIVGANLATTPPKFLFQTGIGMPLVINLDSAQTVDYAFSYFEE